MPEGSDPSPQGIGSCPDSADAVRSRNEREDPIMKTMGLLVAITISTVPTESRAQAVRVTVATPTVRFETAPQLVEVSPGVQVVPEYGDEVFFVDGWYWCRSGGAWFRTRDYRGGWVVAERAYVPTVIVKAKPGKYRYYRVAAR